HLIRDLERSRFSPEFLNQLFDLSKISIEPFDDVNRQTDQLPLIDNRPFDVLANPPRGIRTEAEPPLVVELLDRFDQPEIAFLDDIRKRESSMDIPLADADHESK